MTATRIARIILAVLLALMCIPAFRAGDWLIAAVLLGLAAVAWPRQKQAAAHKQ